MSNIFSQTTHFVSNAESELSQAFDSDFNIQKQTSFRIIYIKDPRTGFEFKKIQVLMPRQSQVVETTSKSSISAGKIATLTFLVLLLLLPFVVPQRTQAQTAPAIGSGITEYRK